MSKTMANTEISVRKWNTGVVQLFTEAEY